MDFIKNIFKFPNSQQDQNIESSYFEDLPVDEAFVQKFIQKKGRFLYCLSKREVLDNLAEIANQHSWASFNCLDANVLSYLETTHFKINRQLDTTLPMLVSCEYLIAENGGILLSSNQLKDHKIAGLSDYFIVFAKISQIVRSKDDSLQCINAKYKDHLPSNISPIINFKNTQNNPNDFLHHGSSAKNVYLLLLEDL